MKKIMLKDYQTQTVIEAFRAIRILYLETIKLNMKLDLEKIEQMRKIFLHTYTDSYFADFPALCYQVCKEWESIGIVIPEEILNQEIVKFSILQYQMDNSLSKADLESAKVGQDMIRGFSMFETFYHDFEKNLKKILVSEFFKRSMQKQNGIKFQIKYTDEKINSLFCYDAMKEKRNFFINQLTIWATYNYVIQFIHFIPKEDAVYVVFDINSFMR